MLYDELVSMDHGPVNSITYNLIDGTRRDSYRNDYITDRENHAFSVTKSTIDVEDLDELRVLNSACSMILGPSSASSTSGS